MDTSIIICTHNRAESLQKTLHAVAQLKVPSRLQWEIIVVDNNSRDHTRKITENCIKNFNIPLRYVFEPEQGLSHARNRGLREAQGSIILFIDDDVRPESEWLVKMLEGMEKYSCSACGGYIAPVWEVEKPSWLTERFYGFLAIKLDTNGPRQIFKTADLPFGANMAFRREIFEKYGFFDTSRGRRGDILASGEDGELLKRLLEKGESIYYFPDSRVYHIIEAFRLKKAYFRRWRYQTSKNLAETLGVPGNRRFFGIPFYMFPQFVRALHRAIVGKLFCAPDEAFNRELLVCHFLGSMAGLLSLRSHIR